jgi:16S rRNA (uracil1498-N3)-methyltransferase
MQFVYFKDAGKNIITLEDEIYKYLFRVRRHKVGEIIDFRNLADNKLYSYKVISVDKKSANLQLIYGEEKEVKAKKKLILGWCIIDPKTIEKTLPHLNEIGVSEIVFIKCAYSQANFKIKLQKLEKILINSCQQCGRSDLIKFSFANSLFDFLAKYPNSYLLDFSNNNFSSDMKIDSVVIGCEGGFSEDERALFKNDKILGFDTSLILKSETAAIAIASKILL